MPPHGTVRDMRRDDPVATIFNIEGRDRRNHSRAIQHVDLVDGALNPREVETWGRSVNATSPLLLPDVISTTGYPKSEDLRTTRSHRHGSGMTGKWGSL